MSLLESWAGALTDTAENGSFAGDGKQVKGDAWIYLS
jgi:hypothetical protein